jgi:hypothetical protein
MQKEIGGHLAARKAGLPWLEKPRRRDLANATISVEASPWKK